MRKFENVDIVAALGAVVELNTEHYKSDFKYDIAQFKEAARNPDGENNYLLWLSRKSGTHCYPERDVYIKDTSAFNTWTGHATFLGQPGIYQSVIVNDRILAFAVEVTGVENGRIKGNLHELDFRDHVKQVNDTAIPKHTVTSIHKDGTKITLPHAEHDGKWQQLYHQHGQAVSYRADPHPKDKATLQDIITQARDKRDKDSRPAIFKLQTKNPKRQPPKQEQPSIKQQIAEGRKQLSEKKPAPTRAAVKNKSTGLGD